MSDKLWKYDESKMTLHTNNINGYNKTGHDTVQLVQIRQGCMWNGAHVRRDYDPHTDMPTHPSSYYYQFNNWYLSLENPIKS